MKKLIVTLGMAAVVLIVGFYAFNNYIYNEKQLDEAVVTEPYRGTLAGEYVCLPHRDTSGPQTDECVFGIETDTGEYYAIDFNMITEGYEKFQSGMRFSASGNITPIENLSTDHWDKYLVEGIFSVTDSVEKL